MGTIGLLKASWGETRLTNNSPRAILGHGPADSASISRNMRPDARKNAVEPSRIRGLHVCALQLWERGRLITQWRRFL